MPSRGLRWLIGLFWVTMMGWLFWHDLWPNWRPGEPPAFHIDDVEEVQRDDVRPKIHWMVQRQVGEKKPSPVFRADTWVVYHKEDEGYTLKANLVAMKRSTSSPVIVGRFFKVESITSSYRVDRDGRLQTLEAEVQGLLQSDGLGKDLFPLLKNLLRPPSVKGHQTDSSAKPISLRVWGEVEGNQFYGHCGAAADYLDKPIQFDLPRTTVSYTGSVLMTLHPVSQISGLRPGQRWHQPLIDPLRDALPGLSSGVRSLNAHVLTEPQLLKIEDTEATCLVIEYTNDENEIVGRTWVEQNTNRVFQQEALEEDDRWIMTREPEPHGSHRMMPAIEVPLGGKKQ